MPFSFLLNFSKQENLHKCYFYYVKSRQRFLKDDLKQYNLKSSSQAIQKIQKKKKFFFKVC